MPRLNSSFNCSRPTRVYHPKLADWTPCLRHPANSVVSPPTLALRPTRTGALSEIIGFFGTAEDLKEAVAKLQAVLYAA